MSIKQKTFIGRDLNLTYCDGLPKLLMFLAVMILSNSLWAFKISVKGNMSGNYSSIELSVAITNIEQDEYEVSKLDDQLEIQLPEYDNNYILKASKIEESSGRAKSFYWQLLGQPQVSAGAKWISYRVVIKQNKDYTGGKSLKDIKNSDGTVSVRAYFSKPDGSSTVSSSVVSVKQLFAKPAEAPDNFLVKGSHASIIASWYGAKEVSYTKDNVKGIPEMVNIFLVKSPEEANNVALEGYIVDSETGKNEKTECRFQFGEDQCFVCDADANQAVYLSESIPEGLEDLFSVFRVANGKEKSTYVLKDLEIGQNHTVMMQYFEGTKRTQCLTAAPIETLSLTEANGEEQGTNKDSRCFVVTASFGDTNDIRVVSYRWFRDAFLLKFAWGRKFIRSYYKVGPYYAEIIKAHQVIRWTAGLLLMPPAIIFMILQCWGSHFFLSTMIILVLLALFVKRTYDRRYQNGS